MILVRKEVNALTEKSLTQEVAEFVAGADYASLPSDVVRRAKEAIVDSLAVALAGSQSHEAQILQRYHQELGLSGQATVVGTSLSLPAPFAAMANGVSGHAMDYDDTQLSSSPSRVYGLLTHPTVPVLSAAMAVAEEVGAGGRELLAALCIGVEVACKLAETISPQHYKNGFHSTGTIGIFGASAASARLLELPLEKTRHALGIAASKSAGIRVAFGTMTKPYHSGAAAQNGVVAARLASLGYLTDPDALDGQWGFFQVLGGGCDPELLRGRLGSPHSYVQPGISIKPYPCGSLAHPSMDTFLELVQEYDVKPGDVEEIRLGTSSNVLSALRYPQPQSELEAKFSIPFSLAILMLKRHAGIQEYTTKVVQRPDVQMMMGRVKPYLHPEIEARGFDRIRSLIEIRLKDGRTLTREAHTSRGTPERPMTHDELEEKFRQCAEGVLPPDRVDKVLDMVYRLEEVPDIRALTTLLTL